MPLNIDIQQILLHMFNLVLLFAISYFLLYSPIKKFMEERKKHYEDMETEARENIKKSEELKALYEEKISGSDAEIEKRHDEIVSEAYKRRDALLERAHKEADEIVDKAKKEGEYARKKSVEEAKQEIEDYVTKAAEKIVNEADPYKSFEVSAKKETANE